MYRDDLGRFARPPARGALNRRREQVRRWSERARQRMAEWEAERPQQDPRVYWGELAERWEVG